MQKDHTTGNNNVEENLLGLTTTAEINLAEAGGVARAEESLLHYETDVVIDTYLILEIHRTAFSHLYDWAGKIRNKNLIVGDFEPPPYQQLPNLMAEFSEQLQFLLHDINNEKKLTYALAYAHHKIVQIHPFHNGNGRTSRLVTNLIAYLHGYEAIQIYHREGDARSEYIQALKKADNHDYQPLQTIIKDRLRRL